MERAIPSHRTRYGEFCQQALRSPSVHHGTVAAKTGYSFAVRTLFSLSIAGFVCLLARLLERCSGGFQWNPLGKVLLTSRGCPCSPSSGAPAWLARSAHWWRRPLQRPVRRRHERDAWFTISRLVGCSVGVARWPEVQSRIARRAFQKRRNR